MKRRRSPRTVLLGIGLWLTASSALLVGAASQTTTTVVNQHLADYWRTTYDILVRPAGSRSPIEERYGLVEANHLSGISGGTTFEQYEDIKKNSRHRRCRSNCHGRFYTSGGPDRFSREIIRTGGLCTYHNNRHA